MHDNGQLRVAHLILRYDPISSGFQAPKCVIRAKDPRLHHISISGPGFLFAEGTLVLECTLLTQPIPRGDLASQSIPKGIPTVAFPSQHTTDAFASSQPSNKEEGEGEEEKEKEIVDVSESDSKDLYEVFNRPSSPVTLTGVLGQSSPSQFDGFEGAALLLGEMGIQRKQKSTLLDLLKSQPGRDAPNKAPHIRLPTPLPALPSQVNLTDRKRKREDKGKEVMEGGKNRPPRETEPQRAARQP